ncbi:hypothetical protein [Haladaptatus pallidirubidus]|uniref:Uncharacterized protein n=1 Tax=Haladaptatus pallidirubidus TaxID=1008152 RepID=A0AAV3UNZ5_9EURY|nr:hypothetical protein [Haladaptatus pallidirubidus]
MVPETDIEAAVEQHDDLPGADDVYDHDEEIPITELFDAAFVQTHTEFELFDELVAASPSDADSADELETIPHRAWDEFVAQTTDFEDEKALVMAARDHWVAKKLDLA